MNVNVRTLTSAVGGEDIEVVEQKGLGHPDTMCDAVAEAFGVALARHYLERFGALSHFNVDKALLCGGTSRPAFRGGRVLAPMQMFLAGRATREVGGIPVPVDEIAVEAGKAWVRANMHALDPDRHILWSCVARGGSTDLVDLFHLGGGLPSASWLANDTSIGVGYWPLSLLERTVLSASDRLRALARERPFVGEDVKVMGVRRGDDIHLTVACAFVDRYIADLEEYVGCRAEVAREVAMAAGQIAEREVATVVNAADDDARARIFLTVTGTSAEAGDDGQVGRGNRVTGLITPYRPMSLEAAAGKNPASHVGKLYSVTAQRIARAVVEQVWEVVEAHCVLVSGIGRRVDDPALVDVRLRTSTGVPSAVARARAAEIARAEIGAIGQLTLQMLAGTIRLF